MTNAIEAPLSRAFHRLGWWVGGNPWKTILFSALFCIATISGVVKYTTENRDFKLWVPQDSVAQGGREYVTAMFSGKSRRQSIIFVAENNGNILTDSLLEDVQEIWDEVRAITATVDGAEVTYQDLCEQAGPSCLEMSVLDLWGGSYSSGGDSILTRVNNPAGYMNPGQVEPLSVDAYVGGQVLDGAGDIASARALTLSFFLKDQSEVVDGREIDEKAEAWELKAIKYLSEGTGANGDYAGRLKTYPELASSLDNEFGASIQGDVAALSTGYMLIIAYAALMLGRLHRVKTRAVLALGAVVTVGMSIGTAFGLSSAFGEFYGPVHSVLPFLLLGIGIDDAFIIANAYRLEDPNKTVQQRTADALGHAGVSITVTSITDFVAFMIGSSTILPALSSFSIWAAIGVVAVFGYQVTFFTGLLVLDSRRIAKGYPQCYPCGRVFPARYCCDCCATPARRALRAARRSGGEVKALHEYEPCHEIPPTDLVEGHSPDDDKPLPGLLGKLSVRRAFAKLGPILTRPRNKIAVVVAFVGLLGWAISGAVRVENEFSFLSFIPDDSYLNGFVDAQEEFFARNVPVDIVMRPSPDDVHTVAVNDDITALETAVEGYKWMDPTNPPDSWHASFLLWLPTNAAPSDLNGDGLPIDASTYVGYVVDFVDSDEGGKYSRNIIFDNSTGTPSLVATRFTATYKSLKTNEERLDSMDGLRKLVTDNSGTLDAFPFSFEYIQWELDKVVVDEFARNVLLAMGAILIITFLLIAHPITSLLVFASIGMTIMNILGLMYYWNVYIDSVSVINVVLALGLAVDYSAHIGHKFMLVTGTRDERVHKTLAEMGESVFNGAFSTFLAVVMLAGSGSYVFRVFFKMFFGIAIFGASHGLIFLPVLLSYFGPAPYASVRVKAESQQEEGRLVKVVRAAEEGASSGTKAGDGISSTDVGAAPSLAGVNPIGAAEEK